MENKTTNNILDTAGGDGLTQVNKQNKNDNEKKERRKEILEFKGVHFKKEKHVPNYEKGAHFEYTELCSILSNLEYLNNDRNYDDAENNESYTSNMNKELNSKRDLIHISTTQEKKSNIIKESDVIKYDYKDDFKEINKTPKLPKIVTLPQIKSEKVDGKICEIAQHKAENINSIGNDEVQFKAISFGNNKLECSSDKLGYIDTNPSSNYNPLKTETSENQEETLPADNHQMSARANPHFPTKENLIGLHRRTIIVNHKTETFEFVLPKIDTGLKKRVSAIKGKIFSIYPRIWLY